MITQKENTLRAMKGSALPEWIPMTSDSIQLVFPSGVREAPPFFQSGKDWFGCEWVWDDMSFGHAPNVKLPPVISDISKWREQIILPDLDAVDWEACAAHDLENVDRENKVIRLFMQTGPFERVSELLSVGEACMAMLEEPEEFKALIDTIADYKIALLDKLIPAYKPDDVFFHDDLGTAHGPWMSLEDYQKLLKPAHKRIVDTVHSYGIVYTHHSCGKMEAFIDDMLEIGVDGFNPIQNINDWQGIVKKYGSRFYYNIGTEIRANYPDTTEEQLREDVRYVIDTFGPTGRLVAEVFLSNAACFGNKDILDDELRKYGANFYQKDLA